MQNLTVLNSDEIRAVFADELTKFFTNRELSPKPQIEQDDIGGIELAMKITGLAKATIYEFTHRKTIPCFKRGKKLYFSRCDLLDWIRDGKRKTMTEIEVDAESYVSNTKNRNTRKTETTQPTKAIRSRSLLN